MYTGFIFQFLAKPKRTDQNIFVGFGQKIRLSSIFLFSHQGNFRNLVWLVENRADYSPVAPSFPPNFIVFHIRRLPHGSRSKSVFIKIAGLSIFKRFWQPWECIRSWWRGQLVLHIRKESLISTIGSKSYYFLMIVDHQIREFGTSPLWKVISRVKNRHFVQKNFSWQNCVCQMCHSPTTNLIRCQNSSELSPKYVGIKIWYQIVAKFWWQKGNE